MELNSARWYSSHFQAVDYWTHLFFLLRAHFFHGLAVLIILCKGDCINKIITIILTNISLPLFSLPPQTSRNNGPINYRNHFCSLSTTTHVGRYVKKICATTRFIGVKKNHPLYLKNVYTYVGERVQQLQCWMLVNLKINKYKKTKLQILKMFPVIVEQKWRIGVTPLYIASPVYDVLRGVDSLAVGTWVPLCSAESDVNLGIVKSSV